ncbi:hypothetical protein MTO96_001508 [Rhipicephalus appendiculatus]
MSRDGNVSVNINCVVLSFGRLRWFVPERFSASAKRGKTMPDFAKRTPHTRASGVAKDIFAADHYERNRGHYLQMGKQLAEMLLAAQRPKQGRPSWQTEMGVVVDITGDCEAQDVEAKSESRRGTPRPCEPPANASAASAKRSAERGADKRSSKVHSRKTGKPQNRARNAKTASATRGKRQAESGVRMSSFRCHLCFKMLSSERNLKNHLRYVHKNELRQTRSRASETASAATAGSSANEPMTEDAPESRNKRGATSDRRFGF